MLNSTWSIISLNLFVLESLMERFRYLHYGLACMPGFAGIKMLLPEKK